MERITEIPIMKTIVHHNFICDECGEDLGTSSEYKDGYYNKLGEYNQKIYVYGRMVDFGWYYMNKCLCDKCADKKSKEIIKTLKKLGFEKE